MPAALQHSALQHSALQHSAHFQPSSAEEREYYEKVLPHPQVDRAGSLDDAAKQNGGIIPMMAVLMFSPLLIAAVAVPTFVIVPYMVKQVKPEWSYGKRVVVGVGATTVLGLTRQLIKKL